MIKIEGRKNTTKAALKQLSELIDNLNKQNFSGDVDTVRSDYFHARLERDNNLMCSDLHYYEWINVHAKFKIQAGELSIVSIENNHYQEYQEYKNNIDYYTKIDFKQLIKCLHQVIKMYNELCVKKDLEIKNFLSFCDQWSK